MRCPPNLSAKSAAISPNDFLVSSAAPLATCSYTPLRHQRWISRTSPRPTRSPSATTVPESGPPPPKALEKAIGARIDFLGYGTGAATQQWNKDQENAKKDAAAGNSITVQVKRSK